MKKTIFLLLILSLFSCKKSEYIKNNLEIKDDPNIASSFYIKDGSLYDANNNRFIMRGINHSYAWFTNESNKAIDDIASTGANTIRIVLSNGEKWTKTSKEELQWIINKCKEKKLVTILEVHDVTGSGDDTTAADIETAVKYWIEMKDILIGQEKNIIINIANEPFGNGPTADTWKNSHINAIKSLRDAGFTHTLMVDGANWGQDWENIMRDNAEDVFNSDELKNVIFSVHMYGVYKNDSVIYDYLSSFVSKNLPIVVGEFAAGHETMEVDEESIMKRCQELNIGYLGWSWCGNADPPVDIVNNWDANNYTDWGNALINGTNGINNTAQICSIFK